MEQEKDLNSNIFLPLCQLCGNILNIKINPITFEINYYCENEDLSKNESYSKFEKKYIKNLSSLNNELKNDKNMPKYKANNYNNILKLFSEVEICKEHKFNISEYCTICKDNICLFCSKEEKHNNHKDKIIKYSDIILSFYEYEKAYKMFEQREQFIKSFINKIENWKKEMIKKIENLENILNKEIIILRKMTSNFNKRCLNYNYINNFNNIFNYLLGNQNKKFKKNNNNDNNEYNINNSDNNDIKKLDYNKFVYDFYKEKNFNEMSLYLFKIFENLEQENNKNLNYEIIKYENENHNDKIYNFQNLVYLKDNYFIYQEFQLIRIIYYYQNKFHLISQINIKDNNYLQKSISVSNFDNKIIHFDSKQIFIIRFNLCDNTIDISEIIPFNNILNCVEIKKGYLLIIKEKEFIILKNKKMEIMKRVSDNITNIIPINNDYFAGFFLHSIFFYNTNTLEKIKTLNNIDFSLKISKFRDEFIICVGYGKINLISIKTKELVQTIEYLYNSNDNRYSCYLNIYIDSKFIFIIPYEIIYEYKYHSINKDFEEININTESCYRALNLRNILKLIEYDKF